MAMEQNQTTLLRLLTTLINLVFPFLHFCQTVLIFPHANRSVSIVGYGSWFEHVQEFWEHHMDANVLFLKYEDMHKVG